MYFFILKRIGKRGASVHRAMLDYYLRKEYLEGNIIDLGAGKHDLYSEFIPHSKDATYQCFDNKRKQDHIDFEKDLLPFKDKEFDTVILLNVLEHLYNYKHILREVKRIKKDILIGSVPFVKWYHADPHDYFRYTHEALRKILTECEYEDIEIKALAIGPYCTAFEQIRPTLPRFLNPFLFSICYGLDKIFRKLRGEAYLRYTMDYYFKCR